MTERAVGKLAAADIAIIAGYIVIVIGFGIWSSLKNRGSVGGYFLAGRSMNWVLIGFSLFASNQGSGHFVGLAGSGAATGIGVGGFELNAIWTLLLLGWVFVPVYIASGVYTMPEYLRRRFGGERIRVYLAVLSLLLSIFIRVAADLYAGALFVNQAVGWNIYVSMVVLLVISALFTIGGGLTAVIWTDFIQTFIMVGGGLWLMIAGFVAVGDYTTVGHRFLTAVSNKTFMCQNPDAYPNFNCSTNYKKCGFPPENSMHLLRAADDPHLPWPGMMIGLTISSIWYWDTDQVIVQRALSAKDLSHAKGGTVLAGWLKILPMWLSVLPGMLSRILYPDEIACSLPEDCEKICGSRTGCTNIAYPLLVINLMPTGARGIMLAVIMSALMSSLTSIFNSASTIFTMDIWCRIRKHAKDMELMVVSRVFVLFMVAIGIAWIPIIQSFAELWSYTQSVTSFLAPPVAATYVIAVGWKRANEQGAFWGLTVGLVMGIIRFAWQSSYGESICGEEKYIPSLISKVHYLHFGIISFCVVSFVCVVVSLATEPIDPKYLWRLTFWTRYSRHEAVDIDAEKKAKEEQEAATRGEGQTNLAYTGPQETGKESEAPQEEPETKEKWYITTINWICGIEKHPELTPEQKAEIERQHKLQMALTENPTARKWCNINAVVILAVSFFFWGFFY